MYPFSIECRRFTFAIKKNKDAIQTCLWDFQPSISKEKAERSHVMIETMSTPKEKYMRLEFQLTRSEHNGSKQRYHVKYCAVMTLLNATKANVWQNNAKLKS
mmetsp:Transcript_42069/g.75868  ORF Transcript_42069/g.75868 Transcript_42069/m.75868 type:complete len:102 (+) Transcript_42069:127-432(+)